MDGDYKTISLRLDGDVMLTLAMVAHENNVTLNELTVAIMSDFIFRRHFVMPSRNRREGKYVGKHRGRHLRSDARFHFYYGQPDSSVAWLAASRRGLPLKARRPRYTSKTDRP
jgi:hypothetical protein